MVVVVVVAVVALSKADYLHFGILLGIVVVVVERSRRVVCDQAVHAIGREGSLFCRRVGS